MPTLYTVKQSAAMLGTSTATIRRIADEFAEHMPDYQPVTGQARKLTDADLRTVYAIQSRLKESPALTRAALLSELSAPGREPLVIPATLPVAIAATSQESPGRTKTRVAISEALESPQAVFAPILQAQESAQRQLAELSAQLPALDRLSARIESLERAQSPQDGPGRTLAIAATVSTGVLIVGIAAAALLAWPMAGVVSSVIALLILVSALAGPSLRR